MFLGNLEITTATATTSPSNIGRGDLDSWGGAGWQTEETTQFLLKDGPALALALAPERLASVQSKEELRACNSCISCPCAAGVGFM